MSHPNVVNCQQLGVRVVTIDNSAVRKLPEFPMSRTTPFDPPAEYATLNSDGPVSRAVMPTGQEVWLITGHEYVRKILVDPRVSSDRSHPNFPNIVDIPPERRRRASS